MAIYLSKFNIQKTVRMVRFNCQSEKYTVIERSEI